jgi:hypothetical protein
MQGSAFEQKSHVRQSDWKSRRQHRGPPRVRCLAATICSAALGSLTASYGRRFDMGHQYRHFINARSHVRLPLRWRVRTSTDFAVTAHRQCPGCAATTRRQYPGASNESLSNITRQRQIVGNRLVPPRRNDLWWRSRKRRSERLGRDRGEGSDGEGI